MESPSHCARAEYGESSNLRSFQGWEIPCVQILNELVPFTSVYYIVICLKNYTVYLRCAIEFWWISWNHKEVQIFVTIYGKQHTITHLSHEAWCVVSLGWSGHFAKAKVSNASRPGSRVFVSYLKCDKRIRFMLLWSFMYPRTEYRLKKYKSTRNATSYNPATINQPRNLCHLNLCSFMTASKGG